MYCLMRFGPKPYHDQVLEDVGRILDHYPIQIQLISESTQRQSNLSVRVLDKLKVRSVAF